MGAANGLVTVTPVTNSVELEGNEVTEGREDIEEREERKEADDRPDLGVWQW